MGGLLWLNDATNGVHFAAFDGHGNVSGLVNGANGTSSAVYEYGPFGELLRATGPMSRVNPLRFSTKYYDEQTDFLYYGYRYYNPSTGRWLNRDPIGEMGGANLFGFLGNEPVGGIDPFGAYVWIIRDDCGHVRLSDFPPDWDSRFSPFDALPGKGRTPVDYQGLFRNHPPATWDDWDYDFYEQMLKATDLFPWGKLDYMAILKAVSRGYIDFQDTPLLIYGDTDFGQLTVRDAEAQIAFTLAGAGVEVAVQAAAAWAALAEGRAACPVAETEIAGSAARFRPVLTAAERARLGLQSAAKDGRQMLFRGVPGNGTQKAILGLGRG